MGRGGNMYKERCLPGQRYGFSTPSQIPTEKSDHIEWCICCSIVDCRLGSACVLTEVRIFTFGENVVSKRKNKENELEEIFYFVIKPWERHQATTAPHASRFVARQSGCVRRGWGFGRGWTRILKKRDMTCQMNFRSQVS